MSGILDGIRILDFTQMKAGPMGTQLLADLGADVIKVERAGTGDWERHLPICGQFSVTGDSAFFLALNRNKRSLAIDLKAPEARSVLYRLASASDVVVQNFRPGVLDRLGLGYADLRRLRPDLIYCSSSGYGLTGPYASRPGQDLLAQGVAGMILANGTRDHPAPTASSVADGATALFVAIAILGAIVHRLRTGEGQHVDVDLMSSLLALELEEVTAYLNRGADLVFERSATGVATPWSAAPYGIYRTQDGRYLALAMNPLGKLADLLDLPELSRYADDRSAFEHRDLIKPIIERRILEAPLAHWLELLLGADVWCGPVNSFDEAVRDPQVVHNQLFPSFEDASGGVLRVVGTPLRYERTPPSYRRRPPRTGEHSREVLEEHGFSSAEVTALLERGVITEPEPFQP